MTPENFCYWLQGLFEVGNPQELSRAQLVIVKEHLQLVFIKKTTNEQTTQEESLPATPGNTKNYNSFTDKILIKSFEIKNATFNLYNVSGPKEHLVAKVENTNLIVSNIGAGKDMTLDFSTEVDYSENDVAAKGTISLALNVNTELVGTEWKNSLFNE